MKYIHSIYLLPALLLMISCGDSKEVKEAKTQTATFFRALKASDTTKVYMIYPGFRDLPSHFKSDSATITNTKKEGNRLVIAVHNRFTNKAKKTFEQDMDLIFTVDGDKVKMTDSRGLCRFADQESYMFGLKTGCIDSTKQTTDIQRSKKIKEAEDLMVFEAKKIVEELKGLVPLTDLKWNGNLGLGMGSAKVTNNSPYPLYYLKYEYTVTNNQGKLLKMEDGFISVDTIPVGGEKVFLFFENSDNGARHLDMRVVYDKYFLMDILKSKKWTGKEYAMWQKNKGS